VRYFFLAAGLAALLWSGPPAPNRFRFAILGDRTGETVPGVYEQVWREAVAGNPDLVVSVGDSIQGLNDATAAAEWAEVRRIWAGFAKPLLLAPGNHDIWSAASRQLYVQQSGRPASYGFDFRGAHFTILDNSGGMQLSPAQTKFLEQDLETHEDSAPKFVVFHQPFWLIPLMLDNPDFPFHRLMKKHHVSAVIGGHTHQFAHFERDGILYLVMGSSGGHLRGHDPAKEYAQGWFFHHGEAEVVGGKVKIAVLEAGPPFGKARRTALIE
jgi:predicted phosphodiesterase